MRSLCLFKYRQYYWHLVFYIYIYGTIYGNNGVYRIGHRIRQLLREERDSSKDAEQHRMLDIPGIRDIPWTDAADSPELDGDIGEHLSYMV